MIDLHSHLLPGVDDGAADLDEAVALARLAVEDGVTVMACTPHIFPGLYDNAGPTIRHAVAELQFSLHCAGVPLRLVEGADVQLAPDMLDGLRSGRIPTLARSRYFLFEPPHHVAPQRMEHLAAGLIAAGYVPIVTHPERLTWIESHYPIIERMFEAGCWIQLTAGAITGLFGKRPVYWSERMLDEGMVHVIASDAHNLRRRRPGLSAAREAVTKRLGETAALDMVRTRPQGVLDNLEPASMPPLAGRPELARPTLLSRLLGERRQ
jgi:protein-tyrosine phosphatase